MTMTPVPLRWRNLVFTRVSMAGTKKANVFPEPVLADPNTSSPRRSGGMALAWISNIFVKPASFNPFCRFSCKPRISNVTSVVTPDSSLLVCSEDLLAAALGAALLEDEAAEEEAGESVDSAGAASGLGEDSAPVASAPTEPPASGAPASGIRVFFFIFRTFRFLAGGSVASAEGAMGSSGSRLLGMVEVRSRTI